MEVKEFKRLNGKTTVHRVSLNQGHEEDHILKGCPDTPSKDFLDQLATVEADLVARTGFGQKFGKGFKLTGIAVSKSASGRRQYTPTVLVDYGWGETGAAMPYLLEPDGPKKKTTVANVLTANELTNVETLLELALEYANGERHQAKLDLDGQESKPANGAAAAAS